MVREVKGLKGWKNTGLINHITGRAYITQTVKREQLNRQKREQVAEEDRTLTKQ